MMKPYTANVIGADGNVYAVYFECEDIVDAENIIKQTGLITDEAGVCTMLEELNA